MINQLKIDCNDCLSVSVPGGSGLQVHGTGVELPAQHIVAAHLQ